MRFCVFGMRYDISVLVGMYLSNNALKVVGGRACRTDMAYPVQINTDIF